MVNLGHYNCCQIHGKLRVSLAVKRRYCRLRSDAGRTYLPLIAAAKGIGRAMGLGLLAVLIGWLFTHQKNTGFVKWWVRDSKEGFLINCIALLVFSSIIGEFIWRLVILAHCTRTAHVQPLCQTSERLLRI